jgi:hypothetical protein
MVADDDVIACLELSSIADDRHSDIEDHSQKKRKAARQAADNPRAIRQSQHADPQMHEDQEAGKKCPQGNNRS